MRWIQPLVSGALRTVAVVLGGAAVSVLIQSRVPAARIAPTTGPSVPLAFAVAAASSETRPHRWKVSADGWRIRVGGTDVDFPTVAETFADHPRTVAEVRLSPYDPIVKFYARKSGFDWRLITAIIAAESGFNPRSHSHMGAYGLMQVRGIAARAVGETEFHHPTDNIRTGVRYLRQLEEYFPNARGRDRLLLMLAAYNMGPGHLSDARQLAAEHGLDPNRWFGGVREVLPALGNPAVYRNLQHGFARGSDTLAYVESVWDQFLAYQRATAAGIFPGPDPRSSSSDLAAQPTDAMRQG